MHVHFEQARAEAVTWARDVLAQGFVLFDSETTGLDSDDEFVQLGVIDHTGAVLLDTLVRPTQPISPGAAQVHGYSELHLLRAPRFPAVYPALAGALAGRRVIVYNADFDRRILHQACSRYGLPPVAATDWDCAMKQYARYRGVWNSWHNDFRWHRLTAACTWEQIHVQDAHSAVGDCRMALELIRCMAAG
ncbi:MAG: 3'-5' exonuclease [Chloroflexi bacterium]|nr:3'-5' exonuclease [Chloroflexota bacterium]